MKAAPFNARRRVPSKELMDAIIATRVHNGFNQSSFARYLGRSIGTVNRWEFGRITPQPGMLAQLLLIAPENARHVFEDYLNKTYDQVVRERFLALSRGEKVADWKANPADHVNEIYRSIQGRAQWIWCEARNRNSEALKELVNLYEWSIEATERTRNR